MLKNLFCILIFTASLCALAQEATIPVSGSSDPNSPVLLRGNLVAKDDPTGSLDYTAHLTVVNASGKDIMLIVTEVSATVTADGVITSHNENLGINDYFLKAAPFKPDSTELQEVHIRPYIKPGQKMRGQRGGDARVVFIQFADGSTWGDLEQAKEFTNERVNAWHELRHLSYIYRSRGKEHFLAALRDPAAKSPYLQTLFGSPANEDNLESLVRELNRLLDLGSSHLAQMGGRLTLEPPVRTRTGT